MPGFLAHLTTVLLPANKWWHVLQPAPHAPSRLWLFPSIGAGAAIWRPWLRHLRDVAEIVAVCLPGREARLDEAPYTRLDELADAVAGETGALLDDRDVFCGHGPGALLAFEVARRLRAADIGAPRSLILSGAKPPHEACARPHLHRLSERDFIAGVERRYGPIPVEFRDRPEFLELLLPALRADLEALETYRGEYGALLDVPILAIAGDRDPLVPAAALAGWRVHTTASFETDIVAGGHFFMTENASEAARRVRSHLRQTT